MHDCFICVDWECQVQIVLVSVGLEVRGCDQNNMKCAIFQHCSSLNLPVQVQV